MAAVKSLLCQRTASPAASVRLGRKCCSPRRQAARMMSGKMTVPSDGFGGLSPEKKASQVLSTFLTFVAARIILAQLEGDGRGSLGSYNTDAYEAIEYMLLNVPLKDGEAWCAELLKRNRWAGVRVLEVRKAYAILDFEWKNLQDLTLKGIKEENAAMMRSNLEESLAEMDK